MAWQGRLRAVAVAAGLALALAPQGAWATDTVAFEYSFADRVSQGVSVDAIGPLATGVDLDALTERIEAAARDLEEGVDVSGEGVSVDDMHGAIDRMWVRGPELFYVTSVTVYRDGFGMCSHIRFNYCADTSQVRSMIDAMDAKVDEALAWADSRTLIEVDKAKALHDYLVRTVSYDGTDASLDVNGAYGALVNGRAVCGGYAEAYGVLLEAAGIEQTCVISAEMNHEWNVVTIDGVSYNVDVTWDDPVYLSGGDGGFDAAVHSSHFLVSDAYLRAHNYYGTWLYAPACTDTRYEGVTWDQYKGPIRPLYRFGDVSADAWYVRSGTLERVIESGIMSGYDPHRFAPDATITRAELACVLTNAFADHATDDKDVPSFTDLGEAPWAKGSIDTVVASGWMQGYGNEHFGAGDAATREQVCCVLHNVAGAPEVDGPLVFGTSPWAREALTWAVREGIIGQGGAVRPKDGSTRIETATMVLRLLDVLEDIESESDGA